MGNVHGCPPLSENKEKNLHISKVKIKPTYTVQYPCPSQDLFSINDSILELDTSLDTCWILQTGVCFTLDVDGGSNLQVLKVGEDKITVNWGLNKTFPVQIRRLSRQM